MAGEWGEAHRREALRRTYEIAAEMVGEGRCDPADRAAANAMQMVVEEIGFRGLLVNWIGLDPARIDREVARVRALAEGRLVRETGARLSDSKQFLTLDAARRARREIAKIEGRRLYVIHVTRIRRAR